MRKAILTVWLSSLLPSIVFSQTPDSTYAKWLLTPEIKRGFDYALEAAKLKYKDFTFRKDYWEIDPARMVNENEFMARPLKLPLYSMDLARGSYAYQTPVEMATSLLRLGNIHESYSLGFDPIPTTERVAEELAKQTHAFLTRTKIQNKQLLSKSYFLLLATIENAIIEAKYHYKDSELDFIQTKFPRAVLEDTIEEKLSVDAIDSIQQLEENFSRDFVPLAARWPGYQYFGQQTNYFLHYVELALNSLSAFNLSPSGITRPILWEDRRRKAIIGGPGPNHYKGDYALIIDLGGDDTYELTRRPNFTGQVIIDLGGNDKYYALEDNALACGNFGYSVLIDVSGDDLYEGKNFSLGCGFFGCGLLWDQAGNDTYIGDQFTEGAGGFGIGILKDDGGNDRYIAARAAQGFGFVRGVGALLDASGNDTYFAGGKYKEEIGLSGEIRYLSEAQGYATGIRPYLSGGMGFLFDYDGDDSYSVDMFGQGSSHWWGLGALVDFKGNDRYVAQQYAQGAGVHMSLGCLVDSSGNDFYYSKGVSQGCGHDLGAGMLFDLSGDDNYIAASGSQAYGSANGIGMLVDGSGDDGYYVKDKKTTQGMGNPRREYGSIAVFLDCGGTDHYDGNGGENKIWKPTGTMWGVGVDGDFGARDSTQVKK